MTSLFSIFLLFFTSSNIIQYQQTQPALWYFDYLDIVYRQERGAHPARHFNDYPLYQEVKQKNKSIYKHQSKEEWRNTQRSHYLKEYYPNEYYLYKTIDKIHEKTLYRPRKYYYPKHKIIIHHSAMPSVSLHNQKEVEKQIQEIEKLHTFYRDRWDIGYHFLVDKFGNIYEGKAWWPWIIGAHAQFNNFDSIGITLLGNFQTEYPSLDQIKALIKLLISLSRYYQLDLNQQVLYHAKSETAPYIQDIYDSPISYHKKIGTTACPWTHLLQYLPFIKEFVKDYPLFFSPRQDQNLIINKIFQNKIIINNPQGVLTILTKTQKNIAHEQLKINDTTPLHWEKKKFIINQRETLLILPKNINSQEQILKHYQSFLEHIAQNKNISSMQRNYFIHNLNQLIFQEQNYFNHLNKQTRKTYFLAIRKIFYNLQSLKR